MANTERAVLAGGCFWGMQGLIRRLPGVLSTRVGYTGGAVPHATYRNHGTHAEGIEILFDPDRLSYRRLLEFFFQIHDPTTRNRQGNDVGSSYRSAIYHVDEHQRQIALDTIADVDASGLWPGRVVTEEDRPDPESRASHRSASEVTAVALAERGVRSAVVRFPPTVHGAGDHGFVPVLIGVAREHGVSRYAGDGANRWSAVHRRDAARLFRLAVERAPAGSVWHGVAEEGVPTRDIAEVIGRHLGVATASIAPEEAPEHFGWIGGFFAADVPASSALTRERLGWEPVEAGLIADLEAGHYFQAEQRAA